MKLKIDFFKCFETNNEDKIGELAIENLETEIELKLPNSYYKNFLLNNNGGYFNPFLTKGNDEINLDIEPILEKYSPKINDLNSEAFIVTFFDLSEIEDYHNLLKENGLYKYQYEIIKNIYKLIPIGLDGDTGIFYIGAKESNNEGKIYFYDYSLDNSKEGDDPSTLIDFICDSFEEYINSFYYIIPD
jgi:hypothetical protein